MCSTSLIDYTEQMKLNHVQRHINTIVGHLWSDRNGRILYKAVKNNHRNGNQRTNTHDRIEGNETQRSNNIGESTNINLINHVVFEEHRTHLLSSSNPLSLSRDPNLVRS